MKKTVIINLTIICNKDYVYIHKKYLCFGMHIDHYYNVIVPYMYHLDRGLDSFQDYIYELKDLGGTGQIESKGK